MTELNGSSPLKLYKEGLRLESLYQYEGAKTFYLKLIAEFPDSLYLEQAESNLLEIDEKGNLDTKAVNDLHAISVAGVHTLAAKIYGVLAGINLLIFLLAQTITSAIFVVFCFSLVGLHIYCSKMLLEKKIKARKLSIVIASFMIPLFPIGTFLGIIILIKSLRWVKSDVLTSPQV